MSATVLILWVLFGLLNLYVLQKADEAAKGNPPFGVYWIKDRSPSIKIASIICGPCSLPFTLWAVYDWYTLAGRE